MPAREQVFARSAAVRTSSLRYPKAQIAAGLFAGLFLGYYCVRPSLSSRSPRLRSTLEHVPGDLSVSHVNHFFAATRRAWGMARRTTS